MYFTRFPDQEQAAAHAARAIADCGREAIAARGRFHWVLAGGRTPRGCYRLLRDADLPWRRVHCWFGDERLLPDGDPERNETMAREELLDHVPIPQSHIHAVRGADAEQAAAAYAEQLACVDRFDFVLLGMGEDGHTASLFPDDRRALASDALALAVFDAPKPPPVRVSMGLTALNNHHRCMILATGAGKREAVARIRAGEPLPAARIADAEFLIT
ncbi:MAG: 6-phosphogluconolactonase [Zetaproteobacteria bacterium]|nr:MAG: 6-phosphogluconolactonase [Zetaproteobacteria bacterium]